MPEKAAKIKPHLRVVAAASTATAAHAALQKPQKCSTGKYWITNVFLFPLFEGDKKLNFHPIAIGIPSVLSPNEITDIDFEGEPGACVPDIGNGHATALMLERKD